MTWPGALEELLRSVPRTLRETPGAGFILETPTWRASSDWGALLGMDAARLSELNTQAARMMCSMRSRWAQRLSGPIVVSGVIGPRGDGYIADAPHSVDDAAAITTLRLRRLPLAGSRCSQPSP